jgi:bifunctional non-homologous end joining protein LigD
VEFTEWTSDGKIRHPSFQGLRKDKDPRQIVRERAADSTGPRRTDRDTVAGIQISHPDPHPLSRAEADRSLMSSATTESIADWIVPHVAGRPLTLVRCPEGLRGDCFFMKHSKVWAPSALRRVRIKEKTKLGEYLVADDIAGIVGLAQMGVLEIHTWNSVFEDVERPNRIVFDLDPGDEVEWQSVVRGARMVRDSLAALQLQSWVKTTGGRGLHIVVPLIPHADWSQCLEFSRALGETVRTGEGRPLYHQLHKSRARAENSDRLPAQQPHEHGRLRRTRHAREKARRSASR